MTAEKATTTTKKRYTLLEYITKDTIPCDACKALNQYLDDDDPTRYARARARIGRTDPKKRNGDVYLCKYHFNSLKIDGSILIKNA